MKFDLTRPCSDCPFRNDRPGYLNKARVRGIIESLTKKDQTFPCHKTTSVGRYKRTLRRDHQSCAGSMIFLENIGWRNAMIQIAERLGLKQPDNLDMTSPVFQTRAQFINAQPR